jgi:nucleotide-binding universal stress UspA family protein
MVQLTRILCPVDFSDHARHALDHAVAMSRWYGAAISTLYVHQLASPMVAAGPYVGLESLPPMAMTEADRLEAQKALNEFVADDRAAGATIDTMVHEDLYVASAIVDRARTVGASVIAMGTHGRSGFQRLLLGSVTEKVVRTAACPVLTVPPLATDSVPRAPIAVDRILCAVDFSDASAHALEHAVSMASRFGATLTVLHVLELLPDVSEMPPFDTSAYRASRFDEARSRLAAHVPPAMRKACCTQDLLIAGKPSREILRVAAEQQSGLVVLGVHGHGVLDRLLFGSTAAHVVRHATCPVMTVR